MIGIAAVLAIAVVVNAWCQVIMGHEWTNFVYHATLFKYITVWPFIPLDDMIKMKSLFSQSASNISNYNQVVANWLPAESIRA